MTPAATITWLKSLPADWGKALAQFIVDTKAKDMGFVAQPAQVKVTRQHTQGGLW